MSTRIALLPAAAFPFPPLERHDLIRFEHRLRQGLARFLPYAACSLYFPGDDAAREAEYIPREQRLLLPLFAPPAPGRHSASQSDAGECAPSLLGVFVARGIAPAAYKAVSLLMPQLAALLMEDLALYKAALCDPVTGLYTRRHFLAGLTKAVRGTADSLRPDLPSRPEDVSDPDMGTDLTCPAVLVIRLHGLRSVVRKHGYAAAEDILARLGDALRGVCPEQGATARVSDYELAVLAPFATAKACRRLAASILKEFGSVSMPCNFTHSRISVTSSVGYALYPQDITGNVLVKPAGEQAQILLRKARLAAALAAERLLAGDGEPVLAFGRILAEGGRVAEALPLSRIVISLGSAVNAREGQRFSVHASGGGKTGEPGHAAGAYKGEIVIIAVRENSSIAEIIHQADPAVEIAVGDALNLLPGEMWGASPAAEQADQTSRTDPVTGLLRHGDFLAAWSAARETSGTFSLALLRLAPPEGDSPPDDSGGAIASITARPEELMAETVRLFADVFGKSVIAGRYGLTSFMAFHPGTEPAALAGRYAELCAMLNARFFPGRSGAHAAAGLAGYPCLDFRKADILENCRKALEYGLLLPSPHVGVFDSLAMTISADKRFSHGDALGAMTEYKQALLADDTNALAWNSLGVTLARLGRYDEARSHFARAIDLDHGPMAHYNMGYSCQRLGEKAEARIHYERCLEKCPDHLYALVRLGQLAEDEGDFRRARSLYDRAGDVPGGRGVTMRYLAGLALREGKTEEARELLHEALNLDPRNAVAMQMLAERYLAGGDDAEVAESLARQSVILQPERKAGWLVLSRALERVGRAREAREAVMRAGAL